LSRPLPPPIPGTAGGAGHAVAWPAQRYPQPVASDPPAEFSTLPVVAGVGAILVLTASLVSSKIVLDRVVEYEWPVASYVALIAVIGYGPSLWWCWFACRRWGTGSLREDIGLRPRWSDLGWGPIVWLVALGVQAVIAAIILVLDLPIAGNTDDISGGALDRTYVVSILITAVIVAPLVEEMEFRGVVLRSLYGRMPVVAVVVLQGVLFGVAHVDPVRGAGNLGLAMILSGVGIVFGAATVLLRRLGPAIVGHAIFNGVVLALLLSGVADQLRDISIAERIEVVDEADVADSHRDGQPRSARDPVGVVERRPLGE
jgi:hypothetical protein